MKAGMPALLRYDLRIIVNSARAAFSRKRDLILLVLGLPAMLLVLVRTVQEGAGGLFAARATIAVAGSLGFVVQMAVQRRLAHLRQDSVMAKAALQARLAFGYALFWHLPAAVLSMAGGAALSGGAAGALWALIAYGAGIVGAVAAGMARRLLPSIIATLPSGTPRAGKEWPDAGRGRRIARLLAGRAGSPQLGLAGNAALFGALGSGLGLVFWAMSAAGAGQGAIILSALLMVVLIGLLARQHAPLWRFILFLGARPAGGSLVPVVMVAALVAGFCISVAATGTLPLAPVAGGGTILILLFASVAVLRALHYATKPRALADFAFQIDLLVIAVCGLLFWPLAPIVGVVRLVQLRESAEARRWLLP